MGATGYFGRAGEGRKSGRRAMATKVHYVEGGKPVCGYKPHPTMELLYCADGFNDRYVECKGCRDWKARHDGVAAKAQEKVVPKVRRETEMCIDQQIAMVRLIRKSNEGEAKVWRNTPEDPAASKRAGQTHTETAFVCEQYAKACTAVIASLERLKRLDSQSRWAV